jgi:hypothetical protein
MVWAGLSLMGAVIGSPPLSFAAVWDNTTRHAEKWLELARKLEAEEGNLIRQKLIPDTD